MHARTQHLGVAQTQKWRAHTKCEIENKNKYKKMLEPRIDFINLRKHLYEFQRNYV